MELRISVEYLAACLYLEEGGAPPGVGGILGFGGSRDAWKGPWSWSISSFLLFAGDPEITRSVGIIHDRGPFQASLDPPNPRKGTCFLNPELGNRRSLLQSRKSHFRKSDATGMTAFAFLGSSVFEGFQPRTLRL